MISKFLKATENGDFNMKYGEVNYYEACKTNERHFIRQRAKKY